LNIFTAEPYPRHTNLEQFQAINGFVAVGIGPLDYGKEFVEKGPPHELLKGDLKFTAERMELVCPPLHISHPKEKHIFNEFLKANPSPTDTQWRELARLFKLCADYEHIFPKLPTMLKQHYQQWKDNQLIVMAEQKMRMPYSDLLAQLAQPTSHNMNPAVKLQNEVEHTLAVGRPDLPLGDAPSNPMPVPPHAAPIQNAYLTAQAHISINCRRCCHQGYCNKWADACGGYRQGGCSQVLGGHFILPSEAEQIKMRKSIATEQAREKKRRQRQKKTDTKKHKES
jgi:hypothetical protein